MAKVKYLIQGMSKNENHQDRIAEILTKEHDKVVIFSAFAKERSIMDIKEELKLNKGKVKAFIGIRNSVTSSQALKCLLNCGVKLFVVDTGSTTSIFHPKTLFAINEKNGTADAVLGSANFTPGGFLNNIENSVFLELNMNDANDKEFIDSFSSACYRLENGYSTDNVFVVDSLDMIDSLLGEGRVVDESAASLITSVGENTAGKNIVAKMPIQAGKHRVSITKNASTKNASTKNAVVVANSFTGNVTEVWKSKGLVERDLTIPSGSRTNSTGSMLLKKGAYKIDQQRYFRDVVFAGLKWSTKPGKASYFEYAVATFHFIINGIDNGTYDLTMKYDTRTDTETYNQRQPNVHLMWGVAKDVIKDRNLLGEILHLYRVDNKVDEFIIDIRED